MSSKRPRRPRAAATAPKGGSAKGGSPKGGSPKGGSPKGGSAKGGSPKAGAAKGGSARRPGSQAREFSAGGVVVRGEEVVVIVPTRRAADGSRVLALPKGHVDPGETPIEAAEREVREETGVVATPVLELGETRYWYRRDGRTIGKSVAFFLFTYRDGDIEDHDDEVEEVRWISLAEAQTALSHAAEREMVALAAAYLGKER
jgi:8-oxo-dGTP pyrophosphatase MutT (NUDIX family)